MGTLSLVSNVNENTTIHLTTVGTSDWCTPFGVKKATGGAIVYNAGGSSGGGRSYDWTDAPGSGSDNGVRQANSPGLNGTLPADTTQRFAFFYVQSDGTFTLHLSDSSASDLNITVSGGPATIKVQYAADSASQTLSFTMADFQTLGPIAIALVPDAAPTLARKSPTPAAWAWEDEAQPTRRRPGSPALLPPPPQVDSVLAPRRSQNAVVAEWWNAETQQPPAAVQVPQGATSAATVPFSRRVAASLLSWWEQTDQDYPLRAPSRNPPAAPAWSPFSARRVLSGILDTWDAAQDVATGVRRALFSGSPVDPPPPQRPGATLLDVLASWVDDPAQPQRQRFVPQAQAPAADQFPSPRSQRTAVASWVDDDPQPPRGRFAVQGATPSADQFPSTRSQRIASLIASWIDDDPMPSRPRFAVQPSVQTVDQPPGRPSTLAETLASWEPEEQVQKRRRLWVNSGVLSATSSTAIGNIAIDVFGRSDWKHWNDVFGVNGSPQTKLVGDGAIGDYTALSGESLFTDDVSAITWNGGTPSSTGNDSNGVEDPTGFTIPVQVSRIVKTVYFFMQVRSGAATFTASLSDGSSTPVVITSPDSGSGSAIDFKVTVTVQAGRSGTVFLNVDYRMTTSHVGAAAGLRGVATDNGSPAQFVPRVRARDNAANILSQWETEPPQPKAGPKLVQGGIVDTVLSVRRLGAALSSWWADDDPQPQAQRPRSTASSGLAPPQPVFRRVLNAAMDAWWDAGDPQVQPARSKNVQPAAPASPVPFPRRALNAALDAWWDTADQPSASRPRSAAQPAAPAQPLSRRVLNAVLDAWWDEPTPQPQGAQQQTPPSVAPPGPPPVWRSVAKMVAVAASWPPFPNEWEFKRWLRQLVFPGAPVTPRAPGSQSIAVDIVEASIAADKVELSIRETP